MGTKMKGIYKGFKCISQIFVVKEREMEIGYPTDVKHVAHIGWDDQSGSAPSWMKEFNTASDLSATSIGNVDAPSDTNSIMVSTWSARDYEQSKVGGSPTADRPKASKKIKRKKIKSAASSPKSSSSMSRSSRASTKSKPSFAAAVAEVETRSNLLTVVP